MGHVSKTDSIGGGMDVTRVPTTVTARDQELRDQRDEKARRVLRATGNEDLLPMLGLAPAPRRARQKVASDA